jgi:hypothetical protein
LTKVLTNLARAPQAPGPARCKSWSAAGISPPRFCFAGQIARKRSHKDTSTRIMPTPQANIAAKTARPGSTLINTVSRLVTRHSIFGTGALPASASRKGRNMSKNQAEVAMVMDAIMGSMVAPKLGQKILVNRSGRTPPRASAIGFRDCFAPPRRRHSGGVGIGQRQTSLGWANR